MNNKTKPLNIVIIFTAFLLVFVSSDSNLLYQSELTHSIRSLFYTGIFHPRLFSVFDYSLFFLSFLLLRRFGFSVGSSGKILVFIWILTLLNIIIIFLNPNHDPKYSFLGLPILSDVSIYTTIAITFSFFFLRTEGFLYFLKLFTRYVLIFAAIKSILLFYLWLTGSGFYLIGFYSILMEEDNLTLFAFLQMLSMLLYLQKKERKYLFLWALIFSIEILSFRRSGMFVSVISLLLLLLFYFRNVDFAKKFGFVIITVFAFYILIGSIQYLPANSRLYVARYVGQFIQVPGVPSYLEIINNRHLEQAAYGVEVGIEILPFWGYGFGHDIQQADISYSGNSSIHNSYIAVWMFQNLFYTIYLLILALLTIYMLIKSFIQKTSEGIPILKLVSVIYLFLFFVNLYVMPAANVVEIKMILFRTILLAFVFRTFPTNTKFDL